MDAGTATVSWLPLTNVVFEPRAAPFQFTTALLPKFDPLTIMLKAGPPALAEFGTSFEIAGAVPALGGVVFAL